MPLYYMYASRPRRTISRPFARLNDQVQVPRTKRAGLLDMDQQCSQMFEPMSHFRINAPESSCRPRSGQVATAAPWQA